MEIHGPPLTDAVARGRAGEAAAALFLRLRGFDVLDGNRRGADGEIDLLAREGRSLVFVEVRLRRSGARVAAPASIDARKRRRLRAAAGRLLATRDDLAWRGRTVRFDVVAITLGENGLVLDHFRNVRL